MSSVINRITHHFRSKTKKSRREQEGIPKRSHSALSAAETTESEAAASVVAPGRATCVIETPGTAAEGNGSATPEEPQEKPTFAQHISEEPTTHFNETGKAAHNFISGSIEQAESQHPTWEGVRSIRSGFYNSRR
jgi:hypothetical protein